MSALTRFYANEDENNEGLKLYQILAQNDAWFEFSHSYIQWLFPLSEPSNFNPDAPILKEEDILLFKSDLKLNNNLLSSFHRFMKFLGLNYQNGKFEKLENFNEQMFTVANHNWLRFTRLIKSLNILGLKEEAANFFEFLESNNYGTENSRQYWREANG